MQCPKCRKESSSSVECDYCGIIFDKYEKKVQAAEVSNQPRHRSSKEPWLAVLLTKVFLGVGHIYAGDKTRGLVLIFVNVGFYFTIIVSMLGFLTTASASSARMHVIIFISIIPVILIVNIYALFDAYKITKRNNLDNVQSVSSPGHRKAWFASFLSAFVPGIGQFYNRQIFKGIAFITAMIVIAIFEGEYIVLLTIVGLILYVLGIKDAFDSAEKLNHSERRFFQQNKIIVIFMLIMFTLDSIPVSKIIKDNVAEAFQIPAGPMYPTLKVGDHLLTAKSGPFFTTLHRGDVVVFPYPEDPKKDFIKRVIGLGGDKIQIIKGELYINDLLVPSKKLDIQEEAVLSSSNTYFHPVVFEEQIEDVTYQVQYLHDKSMTNGGPWIVPQGAIFVLGDNRDNSQDSRFWGFVETNTIKGKALKLYWSWDSEAKRVRWERIGTTIY